MITLTPDAVSVIRRVTDHPRLERGSGLRISGAGTSEPLAVRMVNRPEPDDRVLERDGGRLFIAPRALERVDGREIDAVEDDSGTIHFVAREAA